MAAETEEERQAEVRAWIVGIARIMVREDAMGGLAVVVVGGVVGGVLRGLRARALLGQTADRAGDGTPRVDLGLDYYSAVERARELRVEQRSRRPGRASAQFLLPTGQGEQGAGPTKRLGRGARSSTSSSRCELASAPDSQQTRPLMCSRHTRCHFLPTSSRSCQPRQSIAVA
jgi:hypothetical protein